MVDTTVLIFPVGVPIAERAPLAVSRAAPAVAGSGALCWFGGNPWVEETPSCGAFTMVRGCEGEAWLSGTAC